MRGQTQNLMAGHTDLYVVIDRETSGHGIWYPVLRADNNQGEEGQGGIKGKEF